MLRMQAVRPRAGTVFPARLLPVLALAAGGLWSPFAQATLAQSQVFPNWTPYAAGADVTLTADTSTFHGGAQSLKFVNTTSLAPNNGGYFQTVPAQPSTLYHLSAWVKGSGVAAGISNCFGINQNFATLTCAPTGTYGWQQMNWNYTTGPSEPALSLGFYSVNVGTLWFDDLIVVRDGTSTNLLANAGFETSTDSITLLSPSHTVLSAGGAWLSVASTASTVNWVAADLNGVSVGSGSVGTGGGPGTIVLPSVGPGWYSLHLSTPSGAAADSAFSVVNNAWINNSAKPNPFGATMHPWSATSAHVGAAAAGGLANVRLDLRWEQVEKSAGVYTWDAAEDALVGYFVGAGIRPVMVLGYANPLYDGGLTPSTSGGLAAYAAYAAAAASHFGSKVDYEVFNEFNVAATNTSACGTSADCYYALLVPTANAIHAAVPGARVIGASTGGFTQDWTGSTPDSYNWLKRLLDLGALAYIDALAFHNYTWPVVTPPEGNNDLAINAIRSLVASYPGGSTMPLWLGETGWPTFTGIVTEVEQAQYVVRDAALALRAGLTQYQFYDLMDDCADAGNGLCRFGMLHEIGEGAGIVAPKPGFTAYSVLARSLAGYSYASSDSWGSGVYSIRFANGSASRRIAWAPAGNTTLALSSTAAVTLTRWDGRVTTLTPTAGLVTLSLGPDPVYLDGSGITGASVAAPPAFAASAPASVVRNTALSIAVSVNGAAAGAPSGAITFRSDYGSVSVTAVAGSTVNGTLSLAGFPKLGRAIVPIEIVQGSNVLGRVVVSTDVTP